MAADELFEVAGELQGVLNAGEGAQLVAAAHAASHETRLTERGPVQVHHDVGFIDAMAPTEVSLATGVGQWAAGRRVALGAALAERFPLLLGKVLAGEVCTGTVQRVVTVCEGLDKAACAKIDAIMAGKLADLDPGRVAAFTRRVATRVAGEQLREAQRRTAPGPVRGDPAGPGRCHVVVGVAARGDLGGGVVGDHDAGRGVRRQGRVADRGPGPGGRVHRPAAAQRERHREGHPRHPRHHRHRTRDTARCARTPLGTARQRIGCRARLRPTRPPAPEDVPDEYAPGVGGQGLGAAFRISTMFSGCEIPGIGVIDADTIETLLQTVPAAGRAGAARRPHRDRAGDHDHRVPADQGHHRLRRHPRRHLPHVGLRPARAGLRPRPRPTLAQGCDQPRQPRRPLPPTPPPQATRPVDLRPAPRRHRRLDRTIGQATHHPRRPHHLATGETPTSDSPPDTRRAAPAADDWDPPPF